MFCPYCGSQIPDDARFCSECAGDVSQLLPEESPFAEDDPPRKTIKPFPIILLCLLGIVLIGGAAVALGAASSAAWVEPILQPFRELSNTRALEKAETCILEKDFDRADALLEDIDSDKADAMRRFVTIERYAVTFLATAETPAFYESTHPIFAAYVTFCDVLNAENEFYLRAHLPSTLKERLDCYLDAYRWSEELTLPEEALKNAQLVFSNDVALKRCTEQGFQVTIPELEQNARVSDEALIALQEWYDSTWSPLHGNTSEDYRHAAAFIPTNKTLSSFLNTISEEVTYATHRTEELTAQYGADARLFNEQADPAFTNAILTPFHAIGLNGEGCEQNVTLIKENLAVAACRYVLDEASEET